MTLSLVVPVKSIALGKSRVAAAIGDDERRRLNVDLLVHTLEVAAHFPGSERTLVVSACEEVLDLARARDCAVLRERTGCGLNAAVAEARDVLLAAGSTELLVVASDLPWLYDLPLRELVERGGQDRAVAIATDRAGRGTNALYLPAPRGYRFAYGEDSRRAHAAEAQRLGTRALAFEHPALAFDLDHPGDYAEYRNAHPRPRATNGSIVRS